MNHDELLAKINDQIKLWQELEEIPQIAWSALRAVVELHIPFTPEYSGAIDYCWADENAYPCPTIQAIEKELG